MFKRKILLILMLSVLFLTGCIGVDSNFKSIRKSVVNTIDEDLKRVIEFSVGPAGITFASMFVSFAGDEKIVDDMMRQVSKVQVSIHKRNDRDKEFKASFTELRKISKELEDDDWYYIVRTCEEDNMVGVFLKDTDDEYVSQMLVVACTDEELVITELNGNLTNAINIILSDPKFNTKFAHK